MTFTRLVVGIAALISFQFCQAKTVTYDWNVTWTTANPDGMYDRKVVGINGQWPLPVVEVDKGDRLIVNMYNGLGDKNTSIHWHGMYQNGTNNMDGPAMVTQCPITPGESYTYDFTVNQNGTYWYHCHTDWCYPDGYRQAFIVHDKESPFTDMYDEELVVTMSDWYHNMTEETLKPMFLSPKNPDGDEIIPNSFLFNDTINSNIAVQPGKTYLIRLINIATFISQYFYIEGHTFKVVEIDGIYTEPTETDMVYLAAAQRYSILVTTKATADKNYPIVMVADSDMLDAVPSDLKLNQTNWLEYNANAPHPQAVIPVNDSTKLYPFDDMSLIPYDRMPLLPEPDLTINVTVTMEQLGDGTGYSFFNNISYVKPKVPTLYTALSSGELATDPSVYGENINPFVLGHNQVVEIILNNNDTGSHSFHMHGHAFQLVDRFPAYGKHFFDYEDGDRVTYDPSNHTAFPSIPARRDTFVAPPQGYFVIRFVADNPGVWMFHCHVDWHLMQGLALTLIEAPLQIQERVSVAGEQYDVCKAAGIPYKGNAAGNTKNLLNLTGQNMQEPWFENNKLPY